MKEGITLATSKKQKFWDHNCWATAQWR